MKQKLSIDRKKELNHNLRKAHPILFKITDILVILLIVFNVGALILTNAMTVKKTPDMKLYEANKIQAQIIQVDHIDKVKGIGFGNSLIISLLIQAFFYSVIILHYCWTKFGVYTIKEVYLFFASYVFVFTVIFLDFANDIGFWIGRLVWGS